MTQSEAQGTATGALVMTGFGAVWALGAAGAASTSTMQTLAAFTGVMAITIALLVPSLALWRASQQLPNDSPVNAEEERQTRRRFNAVGLAQGAAIGLAIFVCNATDHIEYIPPVIALIVGVHFLPLAALFQVRLYYAIAAFMILIPLIVMIAVPKTTDIGAASAWMAISMAGSAAVLWLTALGALRIGRVALSGRAFSGSRE